MAMAAWVSGERDRDLLRRGALLLALAVVGAGCQGAPSRDEASPPAEEARAPAETADEVAQQGDDAGDSEGEDALVPPGVGAPGGVAGQVKLSDLQADRELAEHFFRVGQRHFTQLDYQRAYDALRRAVNLDPANTEAVRLYREAGAALGVRREELETNLERLGQEARVKVQLLRQEMINFFDAGEQAFGAREYEQAIRDFERVTQIIAFSPYEIDPGSGADSYGARARQLLAESKQKRLTDELERRDRKEQEMVQRSIQEERKRKEQRSDRIKTMLGQATDLLYAHRYKQAMELADKILELDPKNVEAKKLREYANEGVHFEKNRTIYENLEEELENNWLEVDNAAIPQEFDHIRYPDDWKERTRFRRPGIGEAIAEEPIWVRQFKQTLKDRQVTLNFNDVPLRDVVLFLQDITGLNFVIAPEVEADSLTVTLRLKDIRLENALRIILEQVGLDFTFAKESLMIVEPGSATAPVIFDIYDTSDLIFQIKDFKARRMTLPDPNAGGGGGGGGGSLIFGGEDEAQGEAITGETLAEIIIGATGGDDVWSAPNSIEAHKGQLLVNATQELHERVIEVLEMIRRNQGWFVHIETRFIDMTNDILEDFGVDFRGLGGNPGDEALIRGAANPGGAFPVRAGAATTADLAPQPPGTFTSAGPTGQLGTPSDMFPTGRNVGGTDVGVLGRPNNVAGGVGRNTGPGNDNFAFRTQNVFGNSFGPVFGTNRLQGGSGLTLQVARLDAFQVNAILRAEYQQSEVTQLTAPRVTAANREKVYVSVVTQRAYISDYDLISGGTGLTVIEVPDPVVETLEEGVVLEVRPTISSDRKYVTLDCRPSLATLVGGQINTVTVNLGAVSMAAIAVPIGVPEIQLQEAFTSVTIPDGGTALLGGFRQVNEQKEVTSIPFLDSVPLLNVFFRRKAHVKEQRSLVILVTAKIMNIRDEETRRFNKE